jgi:hypothetical protein
VRMGGNMRGWWTVYIRLILIAVSRFDRVSPAVVRRKAGCRFERLETGDWRPETGDPFSKPLLHTLTLNLKL